MILRKYIQPTTLKEGIQNRIGWHTYSTLLRSVGAEFKVMQESLHHSTLRSTMDVYTHPTFRHTYSMLLVANGENVKVVQELMRHANAWTTLDLYTQARLIAKRQAQKRVVESLFSEQGEEMPPVIQGDCGSQYLELQQ